MAPGVLSLSVADRDGAVVISATGEIDMASGPALREALVDAVTGGRNRIVLDLAGVTFIDSIGLGVLVGGHKRVQPDGVLAIAATAALVNTIFELTGIAQIIPMASTVDEALELVRRERRTESGGQH